MVEIYTGTTCPTCHVAKDFLEANNIEYVEHNITEDKEARKALIRKGAMSVPSLVVNEQLIIGFNPVKIKELLGI